MKTAVIGGGMAGLTAAYRLAGGGHEVTVLEARDRLGGQASTFPIAGTDLEVFYHHLFTGDRAVLGLIDELGLESRMQWLESKVGFFHGGTIYDFTTPVDLLMFRALPPLDRVRLGLITLYLQRRKNWQPFESITAADWIRKYGGERIFETVWGAQIRAKFGELADQVSMAWFWGKIHLRLSSRQKGLQKERLGYMAGSFQRLTDALEDGIRGRGGAIRTASPVEQISHAGGTSPRFSLRTPAGSEAFDLVVATVPSPIFLRIAPDLGEDYSGRLARVRYQSAVCLVMQLKRPFSHIYWMNISDRDIPFIGVIEHTNFISPAVYGGKHILYVTNYVSRDNSVYGLGANDLLDLYEPHLKKINAGFDKSWVEKVWCFKDDAAQPVITTCYSQYLPSFETPVPGLYLANTTQIYPEDRGMNYSVALGEKVSSLILGR